MKKLLMISICMVAIMMACTNKGKTAPGDVNDSDSVAIDSMSLVEEVDTTPKPMFIYIQSAKNMMMCYWTNLEKPVKNSENEKFFDEEEVKVWEVQDGFRRNAALYTKLLNEKNKCLGIKYIGEQLRDPDGRDASYGELHGREQIPAAGMKFAFTDEKFNPREMWGMFVAVTDEYLASRKLIDMRQLEGNKPLPSTVVKQLEAEYKMKTERSLLSSQGNKYSYGVLQFKGKYRTAKEFGQKVDKCLALEVIMAGDKVYSFPVEGYLYDGMSTWHADDDGEYYPSHITLFEAPDDVIEIAFSKGAPESITTGMYYIQDGKMSQVRYAVYHSMIDEDLPLWKKDIAQLQKLYDAYSTGKKYKFCKYRWLDIDNDDKQEIWLRAEDDKHGALFTQVGGKWKLIAVEDGGQNTLDEILPEGIAIYWQDFTLQQKD